MNRMTNKAGALGFILLFASCLSVISAMADEEQRFREELASDRTRMDVSFEKYQTILSKLLRHNDAEWDIGFSKVLLVLGIIALVAAVIFFGMKIRSNLITEARDEAPHLVPETVATEKVALAHAETAEAASDFRHALRFLYLSAILHLQERGLLTHDKSLTNWEYLRALQTDAALQRALLPAIQVFDEVWYGYKPCDAETVANYRELLKDVYRTNR